MPKRGDPFSKGDLYIQFKVDFPSEAVSKEAAELLRQALPARVGGDDADAADRATAELDLAADDV